MMMRRKRRSLAVALLAPIALASCAHVTRITTEPDGAQVFVNGVPLGRAPIAWETRSGVPDEAFAKAELDGFVPARDVRIPKSYRADASLLLLLLGIAPYFFSARYEDEVAIKLEPLPGTIAPVATPASSSSR